LSGRRERIPVRQSVIKGETTIKEAQRGGGVELSHDDQNGRQVKMERAPFLKKAHRARENRPRKGKKEKRTSGKGEDVVVAANSGLPRKGRTARDPLP